MGILRERCNFRTQFVRERRLWRMRRYDRFWLWIQPVNAPHYDLSNQSVADEAETSDPLHGKREGADV